MSAKRPAPKSGKGKAVTRSAAGKSAARKPAERVKAAAHVRKTVTQPKKAPARRTAATTGPASTARKPPSAEAPQKPAQAATRKPAEATSSTSDETARKRASPAPAIKPTAPVRPAPLSTSSATGDGDDSD